jgi:beta-alanine degradation protein BauB
VKNDQFSPSTSFDFRPEIFSEETETHRVPLFENEQIRIWKTVIHPNSPLKMHRHDRSRVLVALKGGTLKRVADTGEISYLSFESGKAYLLGEDPENSNHADINESNETIEVMIIEFKNK